MKSIYFNEEKEVKIEEIKEAEMSIQELPENRSGAIDPRLEIAYNSNC